MYDNQDLEKKRRIDLEYQLECGMDGVFIRHIQSHLEPGQEVICKICGKTAKEILEENRHGPDEDSE